MHRMCERNLPQLTNGFKHLNLHIIHIVAQIVRKTYINNVGIQGLALLEAKFKEITSTSLNAQSVQKNLSDRVVA